MVWPFKRKSKEIETRAAGSGFTSEIIAAREAYISGRRGIGELTATVQSCVALWEAGLSISDVEGTDLLTRRTLALAARSLALRGEAVFLIRDDRLVPCSDWDLRTRDGAPTAYRVSVSEAGGGRAYTVLSGEVLHFRIGCDVSAPYYGTAPLKRAQLTAGLLHAVEEALAEVYELAPVGSAVVSYPEAGATDLEVLARGFRGARGRVLLREATSVVAAGGPTPSKDWRGESLSPDLERAMPTQILSAARDSIALAFGVLPALASNSTTGPLVREAQRHLASWVLQPIAEGIAEEAAEKLGVPVKLDVMRPLQAYDAGGRARALKAIVDTLATAKAAGVDPDRALALVDWSEN